MRKYLIMSLMASAAIASQVSAADDQRRPRGGGSGDSSSSSNDDSQSRPSRPAYQRSESSSSDDSPRPARSEGRRVRSEAAPSADGTSAQQPQQQQQQQPQQFFGRRRGAPAVPQAAIEGAGQSQGQVQAQGQAQSQPQGRSVQGTTPFQQRLREHRAARGGSPSGVQATTARTPGIAGGPRGGFLSGRVATAPAGGRIQVASRPDKEWYAKWRAERRYNWEQHRARNRDHYHLGNYWDPYGYDYRRWQIGWMMWPSYYQDSYWLNDPYSWRLPQVYGPYRWVRYYDDALLVNIYSGQVVDVLYNVFW